MFKKLIAIVGLMGPLMVQAAPKGDYLIQVTPEKRASFHQLQKLLPSSSTMTDLKFQGWIRVELPESELSAADQQQLSSHPDVLHVQPNYKIEIMNSYKEQIEQIRQKMALGRIQDDDMPVPDPGGAPEDNPELPSSGSGGQGPDPLQDKKWGMDQINAEQAWRHTKGSQDVTVAVIDTGVDYTHEDLVDSLWRNPGEQGNDSQGRNKATNGVDDDGNGYVDDVIGWDFVSDDRLPFDLKVSDLELITGGNPGHGTHCAGNVAAHGNNGKGVAGVAPNVNIMALRFISKDGQGTTADAIKSIRYAVKNGADVLSNSWGSKGKGENNQALKDAINHTQEQGRLFVAAAGNGRNGKGYNNDTDSKPAYPASYPMDIIVSVAAVNNNGELGEFSNWGPRTVDLAAPGVKIFSTVVGDGYSNVVLDLFGNKVTWDGTSMATPHVAGAAALYWSKYPQKSWREVKEALMSSVRSTSNLANKIRSGGRLDVGAMMQN